MIYSRREVLGPEHPDTLQAMASAGQWEDEDKIDFHVAEASMQLLGPDDPQRFTSISNLVSLSTHQGLGRLNEAEDSRRKFWKPTGSCEGQNIPTR